MKLSLSRAPLSMKENLTRVVLVILFLGLVTFAALYFTEIGTSQARVVELERSNRDLQAQLAYSMSLYSQSQDDLARYRHKLDALAAVVLDLATQLLNGSPAQTENTSVTQNLLLGSLMFEKYK